MSLAQKVAEIQEPEELAPVLVAALANMGSLGRDGTLALIEHMQGRGEEFFDSEDRANIGEAISWLAEEVSVEMDFR